MPKPPQNLNEFSSLIQLIKDLRGPEGCPWDKEQTHETLAPYAIEEMYEMVDALHSKNDQDFCEELGDVLFQVVLHAELAAERNAFTINDVIKSISEKLVRRHPHVFSSVQVANSQEVIENWDKIKAEEKKNKPKAIFKAPKDLPALMTSQELGTLSKKINFDWQKPEEVLAKVDEEINELKEAISENTSQTHIEHEIGDVLFSVVQLARHLNIDSEQALRKTNLRFKNRVNFMFGENYQSFEQFKELSQNQKELLWKKAKQSE